MADALAEERYVADRALATSVFLALKLQKPLFLEGEPGVGKTELARVLSAVLGRELIRLQCYEGLDVSTAVYEWNYSRQMLHIRLLEAAGEVDPDDAEEDLFGPEFLLERPLLRALRGGRIAGSNGEASAGSDGEGSEPEPTGPPVLLIDELDRADEEFEAFLLEILSDYQVTIPEIGTIRADEPPIIVITSNRTREVHDALKRRCLYAWIDYPSFEKECEIVRGKIPGVPERLAEQAVEWVQRLRAEDLYKRPGVAETLDWVTALAALGEETLSAETVDSTLGVLLKYHDDLEAVRAGGLAGFSG